MMKPNQIKPSQRRRKPRVANTELKLHSQLARARGWQRRLTSASAVATGVSVLLWLLGAPLLWHLASVTLSFVVGLAYRSRGAAAWALSWIASRAGLSYQTALELDPQDDDYGFSQAIQARALTTTNRLEPPQTPRWWLPLTALAFGLALLPFTPFRDANRFAGVNVPSGLQGADVDAASPEAQEPEAATPEEDLAEGPDATDTPRADEDAPSVLDEFDDTNAEAPPEGVSSSQSEEEALSRFTENLSEREPPEQTNPFESVPPETQPNASEDPREGEANTQSPSEGESQEQAQEGQQEGAEQAAQPDEGSQDQTQGGEEESPSADAQAEGEQQGEQESQGAQDPSATEATEQGAEQEQNALDEGGNDAAGQNASAVAAEETADLSQQEQAEPEFVEGQLGEGPSTLGGTIRLPGSSEDGASVTGTPGSFNQAEEQAITEGRLPVEYQDIVRNYFR